MDTAFPVHVYFNNSTPFFPFIAFSVFIKLFYAQLLPYLNKFNVHMSGRHQMSKVWKKKPPEIHPKVRNPHFNFSIIC